MSKRGARQRQSWTTPRRKPPLAVAGESPPSIDSRAAEVLAYWKQHADTACQKSQAEARKWNYLFFVYFVQDADGPVKIGQAQDPVGRLSELQCGNPQPLRLAHVIVGGADTERDLHQFWRDPKWLKCAWIRNEWFGMGYEEEILAMGARIAELQIQAFEAGDSMDDVRSKIIRRGMFQRPGMEAA